MDPSSTPIKANFSLISTFISQPESTKCQHHFVDVFNSNTINDPQFQQNMHLSLIFENISMNGNPRFIISGGDFISRKSKERRFFHHLFYVL